MNSQLTSERPSFHGWRYGVALCLVLVALAATALWLTRRSDPTAAEVQRVLSRVRREERAARVTSGPLAMLKDLSGPFEPLSRLLFGDGNAQYNSAEVLQKLGTNAVPPLVAVLQNDRSPAVRRVAAEALGGLGGPLSFRALTNAATVDTDGEIRGEAASALIVMDDEQAVPTLLAGIARETNDPPRSRFVTALASLGQTNHASLLASLATNDPIAEVRAEAISGVAELGGLPWADFVEAVALQDQNPSVRANAVRALGGFSRPESLTVLTNLLVQDTRAELHWALASALESLADPRAVPAILDVLTRTNSSSPGGSAGGYQPPNYAAESLVRVLGELGDRAATPVLAALLTNQASGFELDAVLEALVKIEGTNSFDLVLNVFQGTPARPAQTLPGGATAFPPGAKPIQSYGGASRDELRESAAKALGILGDPRAVPPLLAVLTNDPPRDLTVAVVTALGQLGDTNAVPPLRELTRSLTREIRAGAAEALAQLGDPTAVELCLAVLRTRPAPAKAIARGLPTTPSGGEENRPGAARALARFSEPRVIEALTEALADEDEGVAQEAAWSLGHLRAAAATPALIKALQHGDSQVQFAAAIALGQAGATNAIPDLSALLIGHEAFPRLAAALGLAWLGQTNGLPALEKALKDRGDWQRFAGLVGLIRLQTPAAHALLEREAAQPPSPYQRIAAQALAQPGAQALTPTLAERGKTMRLYAVRALLMFSDPATLPALRVACHDRDAEVREAARLAVRRVAASRTGDHP